MVETTTKLQAVDIKTGAAAESGRATGRDAHIVILRSGGAFFGIDINIVQEIVLMQDITEIPGSASCMSGMTDLRGRVVPVSEFSTLLGKEACERTDDTRILVVEHGTGHIGLIVDAVTEVMLVDGEKIEDATTIGAQDHEYVLAVAKMEDHLVSLIDIERLLATSQESLTQAA